MRKSSPNVITQPRCGGCGLTSFEFEPPADHAPAEPFGLGKLSSVESASETVLKNRSGSFVWWLLQYTGLPQSSTMTVLSDALNP